MLTSWLKKKKCFAAQWSTVMGSDALKWADMMEDDAPIIFISRYQTAETQTSGIVLFLDPYWTPPWLGTLCDFNKPELPDFLENEILSYMSWLFEMMLRPCTDQLYTSLQHWQGTLRARIWFFRLHYAFALAVFGMRF